MRLLVAPIQGHTDASYRRFHAEIYGAADEYTAPFLHIEHGAPRQRDVRDITVDSKCRPQILFRNADEFTLLVSAVKEAGHTAVDLNIGCPFPPQMHKGRGAAMIANAECMSQVGRLIAADPTMDYSLKMRLGATDTQEWQTLLEAVGSTPFSRLTMHPRVASQQYGGEVDMAEFDRIYHTAHYPIVYNGDVTTLADIDRIAAAYPALHGIMIGRGLLRRPSLMAEWRAGKEWTPAQRLSAMLTFHQRLLDHYSSTLCGDSQILSHIKPFWEYSEPEIGHKAFKLIKKATTLPAYLRALPAI